MKYALTAAILAIAVWFAYDQLKPDVYVGFFYPDANNLLIDVMSDGQFSSMDECRAWVNVMALERQSEIAAHGIGYDYECGKNCDLSGGKPFICEETLR